MTNTELPTLDNTDLERICKLAYTKAIDDVAEALEIIHRYEAQQRANVQPFALNRFYRQSLGRCGERWSKCSDFARMEYEEAQKRVAELSPLLDKLETMFARVREIDDHNSAVALADMLRKAGFGRR